jgi:hypothetical protein
VVVAIDIVEVLRRHSEIFGRLTLRRPQLHQPGRRRVPQDMRRDPREPYRVCQRSERLVHVLDRLAVPLDHVALPGALPAPHMGKKTLRQRGGRPALLRLPLARGAPIEDASGQVYPILTDRGLQRGAADGSGSGARIEADQNEPRQVGRDWRPVGWPFWTSRSW